MLRPLALFAAALLFAAPAAFAADEKKADEKKAGKFDRTKLFDTMDADGDGKVTKEEFKKGMEKLAEKLKEKAGDKSGAMLEKLGGQLADKAFEKLDADGDGKLTREEFEKAEFDPSKLKDLRAQFGKGKKADK